MTNLKRNLGYQTVYQVLNTCIPLITSPYLSRVLGAKQLGIFTYTQSIVSFFTLFAMLGVINYGTKTIALCGENVGLRSDKFWNIYATQFFLSLIMGILYFVYLHELCNGSQIVAFVQSIYILNAFFDISWLFFGIEDFKRPVTINMVGRIVSVIAMLTLVKSQSDTWIYALIMVGSMLISNICLFLYVPQKIDIRFWKYIKHEKVITNIYPNLLLFVPLLAMSIYHIMDKTMLGILSTFEQTGFYYNADKIINIPIGIITGIGTVMLPRMTSILKDNDKVAFNKVFFASTEIIFAVSCAMTFGISAIAKEFVPFFFGAGYQKCISLIILLSPVLVFKSLSQTARMQYLVPMGKDRIYIQSVCIGAIINLIINAWLIPFNGAEGAVIGTLMAELISCIWQYIKMNKSVRIIKLLFKDSIYLVFGFVMFVIVRSIASVVNIGNCIIIIEIFTGMLIYASECYIYWVITNNPLKNIIHK